MTNLPYNNLTFRGFEPTWANACVGENGNPQIIDYANGFSAAANLLLDQVIADEGMKHHVDDLIYPICFNMRHSVELHLKATAVKVERLSSTFREKVSSFDLNGSHDIGRIWAYIKEHAGSFDKRYIPLIGQLEKYINDIADIDATGQVFRYPFDTDKNKHLVEVAIINVVLLKTRFNKLEKILLELHYLNEELREEYSLGSFTSKLSRKDLFELAGMLPIRDQWEEESFDAIREQIKKKFGLGSNDLSRAIKIIERNYEMAQLFKATPVLPHVDLPILEACFDWWTKFHDINKLKEEPSLEVSEVDDIEDMFEDMKRRHQLKSDCWIDLEKKLNPCIVAELTALFYFQYENKYSERFRNIYELHYAEISKLHEKYPAQYRQAFFHILDKMNGLENVLHSLYLLGQIDSAEELYKKYDLDGCFPWLPAIRAKLANVGLIHLHATALRRDAR
jgi:hypothetical protein